MYKIFVFESQISHAIKKQTTFSLKQPKAMPACRRKKRVYFPFDILFLKLLKSDPQTLFSHIQTSAIKRKYPTLIVPIFLFQRAHIQYRDIFIFKHMQREGRKTYFWKKSTKIPQPSPAKKKRTSPYRVKLDGTEHLNATCIVFRYSYVLWPRLICYSFFV